MLDLYEPNRLHRRIFNEKSDSLEIERVEYGNGIKVFAKGHEYPSYMPVNLEEPHKNEEALKAVNVIKKILLESKLFSPLIIFYGLTHQGRIKLIKSFNRIAFPLLGSYFLKPHYQSPFTKEFAKLIENFLFGLDINQDMRYNSGVEKWMANILAQSLAHIFEYDQAYRYRFQDLFGETTPARLAQSPIREITRLVKIAISRDQGAISRKFKLIYQSAPYIFLIPRCRKSLRKALQNSTFTNLQPSKEDIYWMKMRRDYNFGGKHANS